MVLEKKKNEKEIKKIKCKRKSNLWKVISSIAKLTKNQVKHLQIQVTYWRCCLFLKLVENNFLVKKKLKCFRESKDIFTKTSSWENAGLWNSSYEKLKSER